MRTIFPIGVVLLALIALPGAVIFAADVLGYEAEINRALETSLGLSHHLAIGLPAALILFAVPPLIILLYFLRLRRKPIAVGSTYLWKKSIEDLHVNRLMQWLRRNVLLLLQLLAVLALIYAILGPRLHGRLLGGKHYILIVDNSASMNATDVKPTRLDWAKAEALKEIDAATDADTGMVIVFNSTAEILKSYTTNRDELRAAVRSIEPTQKPTRIDEALALAASLANPQKSTDNLVVAPTDAEPGKERQYVPVEGIPADVHLFSDGRFPSPDFALANLSLSLHVPPADTDNVHCNNLGVTRIDVQRGWQRLTADDEVDPRDNMPRITDRDADDPNKLTVSAILRNYRADRAVVKVILEVYEDGSRLVRSYSRTVALEGFDKDKDFQLGRTVGFQLTDVPEGADRTLKVFIENPGDDFPLDDSAWLAFGIVRKAKVLIVSPDNNFLLRAFFDIPSTKALADVAWLTPSSLTTAEYLAPGRDGKYDLVVFDRCGPGGEDQMPAANTLFLGQPPPPYKMEPGDPKSVTLHRGPTVQGWDDRHPLMTSLRGLYDIGIDEAFKLPDTPEGSRKLMEADRGHVLLLAIPRSAFTDLVLSFGLLSRDGKWNTRWPLENSFVLFLRNVLLGLGNVRDASAEEPTLPGREKILRPGSAKKLTITRPDGSSKSFERGNRPDFIYSDTGRLGVYTAEWDDQTRRFAVNLFPTADHDEGDLAPVAQVTIGNQTIVAGEPRKSPRDLWKYVVLAGLVVVLLEWWVYNKRVQI